MLRRLPAGTTARGVILGIACVVVVAPIAIGVLVSGGIDQLALTRFLAFKALFAGVLGAIVTPVVALAAPGDAE